MAPHAAKVEVQVQDTSSPEKLIRQPLKYSGSLDQYRSFEHTPIIGTEFPELQLTDIIHDDNKLRDLAITVSQRGVVFLRNQQMNADQQKLLAGKLGELTGKPTTSGIHRHVLAESQRALATEINGKFDDEVWVISSDVMRDHYPSRFIPLRPLASDEWHTDLAYENVPSDYAILHITENPEDGSGGDTLWASGCEAYDRLSPPFQKMVENMKVVLNQARLGKVINEHGLKVVGGHRGASENSGSSFRATHPVVRTNPVTGWKSLYGAGVSTKEGWIEGVTKHESEMLKQYFIQLISQNHDLQVRFKWGRGDVAIWDNRSVFHVGTDDFEGRRRGNRVLSLGEIPYFDPASKSRREALYSEV